MIKVEKISVDHLVIQSEGNVVSDMDNEKVMLNIENGKYYNLGRIGGDIWELIDKPTLVSELIDNIMAKYDVNKEKCEAEVISFLGSMYQENLVKVITRN
ncbi:lasso peptide biosynthesis PqqD family chaperone [Priestia aryabhattai]|uniref:lasso peptide biosynthesis PqqD family chaperone n=1 Tax=Priestia TaxID=2800373 RepID=UPI00263AF837|nr:lasso peptide biosynthesis PqqD family chaperone [Priestia megaterium]MDN4861136.1 lasso peptide biosynthesis PqqD family chaperone [Priestia megaterium]